MRDIKRTVRIVLPILLGFLATSPGLSEPVTDAASREFSASVIPLASPSPITDACSREFSVCVWEPAPPSPITDACSREFSVCCIAPDLAAGAITDANSREFSTCAGPVDQEPVQVTDASGREFSTCVTVQETDVPITDAASREFQTHVGPLPAFMARKLPLGREILLEPSAVTAAFPGFFYIESADRVAGVRVAWSDPVTEGVKVEATGVAAVTDDFERVLNATSVVPKGVATVGPLGVGCRWLGGGDFRYSPSAGTGQRGLDAYDWNSGMLVDVLGLNNVGLLVKVWGKVTWSEGDWFTVDDGTGRPFGDPTAPGVMVIVPPEVSAPPSGAKVAVTGISSCYRSGEAVYRLLRVRSANDIVPLD